MGYREIANQIHYPQKTSERYRRLDALDRLRAGTLYEHIRIPFDLEYANGQYIKLRERRPAIIWNGAKMLAEQLAGLLWGDEQMPIIRTYEGDEPDDKDRAAEKAIQHISETLNLDAVMDEATCAASSASCAVVVRATDDKEPYIEVLPGRECTPTFHPRNPYKLLKLEQLYPTTGAALAEMGYTIKPDELTSDFWYRLVIDNVNETRYQPMRSDRFERLGQRDENGTIIAWVIDEEYAHGWSVVPVVWIKGPHGNHIDGDCLYGSIVDTLVDIDYTLSQIGRGFRYTADPMIAVNRGEMRTAMPQAAPAATGAANARAARASALGKPTMFSGQGSVEADRPFNTNVLSTNGEAKLLEISGQGLDKSREFVKLLREWGLEICGGMKTDAETTKGVESGRALEILYQALILVVKRWRVAVGNKGYIPLMRLLLRGMESGVIEVDGAESVSPDTVMRLVWPEWMTPSGADLQAAANAWQTLAGGSTQAPVAILPRNIVTRLAGMNLGMTDVTALLDDLEQQMQEDEQKAQDQAKMESDLATQQAVAVAKAKPAPKGPTK